MEITVNEMLISALTTESRKKKSNYQKELENLGYEIYKYDGAWTIINLSTKNEVKKYYSENALRSTNHSYIPFGRIYSHKLYKYVNKPLSAINIEKMLSTPIKNNYYSYRWEDNTCNDEVYSMKSALRNRNNCQNRLNNALSSYQSEIDKITEEYQKKLKNAKQDFDWCVEYNTKEIKKSEEIISKLLKK